MRQTDFFVILGHFLPFYLINNPKNQNFEKLKKKTTSRKHHFTQVYHKCQSYDVWFLRCEAWLTEFFVILGHFLPFNKPKNKNFQKMKKKKSLDISSFYTSVPKIMIICYTVPEIRHVTDVIRVFDFGLFSTLLLP